MVPFPAHQPGGSDKVQWAALLKRFLDMNYLRMGRIVTVASVILVALYSVYWFLAAAYLKDGVITWFK